MNDPQAPPEQVVVDGEPATPQFSLFFGGIDPAELGEPTGVQDLFSRLSGYEQHINAQIADLHRRLDDLEQQTSATVAALRQGVNRATGVDPLSGS